MKKARTEFPNTVSRLFSLSKAFPLVFLLFAGVSAHAFEALEDADLSDVTGEGIVYALDDFSFRMAPTSYIELTGSTPVVGSPAALYGWKRGDARYYGLSFTYGGACSPGTGPGTGTACGTPGGSLGESWYSAGTSTAVTAGNELSYAMGKKTTPGATNPYGVPGFASVYNPFILRVFQSPGYNYTGTYLNTAANMPTYLEFVGPSKTDPWRWAFWGELEVARGATCPIGGNTTYCGLQSQTIIHGTPTASGQVWQGGTTYSAVPAQRRSTIFRMMQTPDTTTGAPAGANTMGLNYQSALSGDFRFSVQQTGTGNPGGQTTPVSPNALHTVPSFNTLEGLYFKNVDAFLPLGYLHSQALIVSGSSTYNTSGVLQTTFQQNGNYVLELARIPNQVNVYNNIYCGSIGTVCAQDANGYIASPNPDTHGYVRFGNWTTTAGGPTQRTVVDYACTPQPACQVGTVPVGAGAYDLPTPTSTANGIYFMSGAGVPVNLGISRIEGMMIQHMKISTLGAGL